MLAWDRWVAKSYATRTTAIQAETKKARLCFVRFLARNASISRRDRQYTFLWPYNTSDGDHDIQAIGCEPVSSEICGNAEAIAAWIIGISRVSDIASLLPPCFLLPSTTHFFSFVFVENQLD